MIVFLSDLEDSNQTQARGRSILNLGLSIGSEPRREDKWSDISKAIMILIDSSILDHEYWLVDFCSIGMLSYRFDDDVSGGPLSLLSSSFFQLLNILL